jgi:hypothetical protein
MAITNSLVIERKEKIDYWNKNPDPYRFERISFTFNQSGNFIWKEK